MGPSPSSNETNDNEILFSIQKNAVDLLITEDYGLHKKANRVDLDDRVLSIDSALDFFKNLYARRVPKHALLKEDFVRNLDVDDPFFDLLKEDYSDSAFRIWFKKISIEGRKCWVYQEDDKIKTLLILKEENEPIETIIPIPATKRLKIATLKVDLSGYKLGELLLKMAFQYCIDNHIFEMYLTHFRKESDGLIHLIEYYGFESVGFLKKNNEEVFLKKFIPTEKELSPVEMSKKYYPSFKDALDIKKFLIPIRPEFHDRLFPDYENRQMKLTDYSEINAPGNAIKKAYLSYSGTKKMRAGDIILFYRSKDQKAVVSLGVVDQKPFHSDDLELILRSVGKRSVYSHSELKDWTKKPVFVILFRHHLNLPKPLDKNFLDDHGISYPQTISEINHNQYMVIKEGGEIDERFTVG
ncbi:MAG: hypothetical protein IBX40_09300 [Methanosarcinales archaeon]|nr:hypothetical protein [Methanosarcinales archaeon]